MDSLQEIGTQVGPRFQAPPDIWRDALLVVQDRLGFLHQVVPGDGFQEHEQSVALGERNHGLSIAYVAKDTSVPGHLDRWTCLDSCLVGFTSITVEFDSRDHSSWDC